MTALAGLREKIAGLQMPARPRAALLIGAELIDRALPWGGLPTGALHEIAGAREDASALAFVAGLAAAAHRQARAPVLWCGHRRENLERGAPYAIGLKAWGLAPRAMVFVACNNPHDLLWAMEEGLRARAFAAVVGDGVVPDFTSSRRLQLAADGGPAIALTLLPPTANTAARHSPALTRWRITARAIAAESPFLTARAWTVALLHCRGGAPAAWTVSWDNFEHREKADAPLSGAVAAPLADGPLAARASATSPAVPRADAA
jgi:protein ImuA